MAKNITGDVRIVTEVTKECRKQLRILAIQKEITLPLVVKEILERAMAKKPPTPGVDP